MSNETYAVREEPPSPPKAPAGTGQAGRRGPGCGWGCGVVAAAVIGAIVGSLIAASLVPWALGIPPWRLFDRQFIQRVLSADQGAGGSVVIRSGETTEQPVVAVAAKVSPSVVFISTQQTQPDLFGQAQVVEGEGSGVIYRSDGYIVTNNHVVSGAERIFVTIGNRSPIPGRVVGRDTGSDIAIVKVEKAGLPAASFGDSNELQVGEVAVAIGAPFGLERTVTSGVISALHRNAVAQNEVGQTVSYANLIQTDAAINPGNSGGALADENGNVIGINTLIRSTSGSSAGIGFAIPIDFVKKIAGQLIAGKTIGHAYIGIYPAPVTPTGPHAVQGATEGALVARIVPGGPADRAGIKQGDVVIKIGDTTVKTVDDLFAAVAGHQPGEKVAVTIVRAGQEQQLTVTLGKRPTGATGGSTAPGR